LLLQIEEAQKKHELRKKKKEEARSSIPVPTTFACPDSLCVYSVSVLLCFFSGLLKKKKSIS
jgi:hypothetical protein